jgi:hypothetical protein
MEFEVAHREFGVVDVKVQGIAFGLIESAMHAELGIEPLECLEVIPLEGVIERLTVKEVSQVAARSRKGRK